MGVVAPGEIKKIHNETPVLRTHNNTNQVNTTIPELQFSHFNPNYTNNRV